MSPEQALGHSSRADARSDVWSLGVMLMELLTGTLPFHGSTTEILASIQSTVPLRISHIDRKLPKDLDTICQKCLEKNPEQRFQAAADLADELDRWRRGEPIRSRAIGVQERLWRWAQRNPVVASLLVIVFVLLLLGTTISSALAMAAIRQARERALAQVDALRTASPESIPLLLQNLTPFRNDVVGSLKRSLQETLPAAQRSRVRLALFALEKESNDNREQIARELIEDLLIAEPAETIVICQVLRDGGADLSEHLWHVVDDGLQPKSRRFRAACALAMFDAKDDRWKKIAGDVVGQLVVENRMDLPHWLTALKDVRDDLRPFLEHQFDEGDQQSSVTAAAALANLFSNDGPSLVAWLVRARVDQLSELLPAIKLQHDQIPRLLATVQQGAPQSHDNPSSLNHAIEFANTEIALLDMGYPDPLRSRWSSAQEPTVRTLEIHRLGPSNIDPQLIKNWIAELMVVNSPDDDSGRLLCAILLALERFDPGRVYISEREALQPTLQEIAAAHSHPGARSAAEWLLMKWDLPLPSSLPSTEISSESRWYRSTSGNLLVIFPAASSFRMGSERAASGGFDSLPPHDCRIPRRYAIATREVTVAEFEQYEQDRLRTLTQRQADAIAQNDSARAVAVQSQIDDLKRRVLNRKTSDKPSHPIADITWFEAAAYCRWLSEQEGVAESQQCYPSVDVIEELYAQFKPLEVVPEALSHAGYRLPTAAEWELACRAGTGSVYPFGGISNEYTGAYAWTLDNSPNHPSATGQLMPNDAGLYDMLGNVCEWCHDWKLDLPEGATKAVTVDGNDQRRGALREVRGGSFRDLIAELSSSARLGMRPEQGDRTVGFRIARTIEVVDTAMTQE